MTKSVKLPEMSGAGVFDDLRDILFPLLNSKDLVLDIEDLERISTTCAQLLASFLQNRKAAKLKTKFINISENFRSIWCSLGLAEHFILEIENGKKNPSGG